ncbi:HU family DNA-binding protein [Parabacteroides bouchesdurhonensis]|uniref:HU family DNA-binding protein n=1 Tax=Parabacteroides bouchesdurhonensis TaxID=1936995 RepID=UPI000E47BC67|nr:HU family DNA-binding protein [Parabacteroides bouchesdurhonensis]RHJ95221.1 DNA-binding protein [Bacteroides sp. AM07-16]
MTAYYDFYKNPNPKNNKKGIRYHARIVTNGTVSTQNLIRNIHNRCTLTPGDIRAVLTSLSEVIVEELQEGRRVNIEGLGYLQMTVECPDIESPKEIRAESVRFKSVAFRPEVELKKKLRFTPFERISHKSHSNERTVNEIDKLLLLHFHDHETLDRIQFQRLCGFTSATANRRLKELRTAGKIKNIAHPRHPLYKAGETLVQAI